MKNVEMSDVKMLIRMNGIQMDVIAKQCGISRRTAYRWLDSFTIERHRIVLDAINQILKERGGQNDEIN